MRGQEEHSLIIELIHAKFNELDKHQCLQEKAILDKIESGFNKVNIRIDGVIEQKKLQNGRIDKLEVKVGNLDKHTKVWQFFQKKPYISIAILLVCFSGILYLTEGITIVDVLKLIIH
jgi:hypothetical protein